MTSKFHQAEGGDEPNGDEDVDEGEEEADDEDDPLEESQVVMQRRYFSSNKSDEGDVFFFCVLRSVTWRCCNELSSVFPELRDLKRW